MFPKAGDDILKVFVLSTAQRYSVSCHREVKKLENIHIWNQRVLTFLLKDYSNLLINYHKSWILIADD